MAPPGDLTRRLSLPWRSQQKVDLSFRMAERMDKPVAFSLDDIAWKWLDVETSPGILPHVADQRKPVKGVIA